MEVYFTLAVLLCDAPEGKTLTAHTAKLAHHKQS